MLSRIPLVGQIVGSVALALILGLSLALFMADRRADKWQHQADRCAEARKLDRSNYERAQAEAKARNLEHVRKVEQRQEAITERVRNGYQDDLARVRVEFERRLRDKGTASNQGATGGPGISEVPNATGGADGAARVCISTGDALRSAETELRLIHLQRWIREQLGTDTHDPQAPSPS